MSAGGIIYFVSGIFMVGFFYLVFGALFDGYVMEMNDQLENPSLHVSEEKMTYGGYMSAIYRILPVLFLVGMTIFAVVIALRESDGSIYEGGP